MDRAPFEVVLATVSLRRRRLIERLSYLRTEFVTPSAEETHDPSDPLGTARANARLKGDSVLSLEKAGRVVIAADTVVSAGGRTLGKPRDKAEAVSMFRALCGARHSVYTALYVANARKKVEEFEKTDVLFGAFDEKIVYTYIESGAPFDKAGGYGIQDEALKPLIQGVFGDYDNVVGLPVALLDRILRTEF